MVSFFFYLFIFFLAVVEMTLLPLNFEVIILTIWILSGSRAVKTNLLLPFLLGVIFDLVLLRPLGLTSLFLVTVAFIFGAYTEKVDWEGRYFLFLFLPILSFIFAKVTGSGLTLVQALAEVVFGWLAWPILNRFFRDAEDQGQLRLGI